MILRLQTLMLKSLPGPMGRGAPASSRRALSSSQIAWEQGTPAARHSRGTRIGFILSLHLAFLLVKREPFQRLNYLSTRLAMGQSHISTYGNATSWCFSQHSRSVNVRIYWQGSGDFHSSLPFFSAFLHARFLWGPGFIATVFSLREHDFSTSSVCCSL